MSPSLFLASVLLLLAALNSRVSSAFAASSINSVNRYAYGANVGWMDWRGDTNNGAVIGPNYCSGSIYAANLGWISLGSGTPTNGAHYQNLAASDYGVNVDSAGNLRGYAYGANIGWINFAATGAPAVDRSSGNLSGYAYGANIGWISLSNAMAFVQTTPLPPPNDLCSDAIPLTNGMLYAASTTAATTGGDPAPACAPSLGKGIWFTYTPLLNGTVTISTCGSSFDTALGIYTGSCGALVSTTCNDDNGPNCAGTNASVSFPGTAGATYFILAGGYNGNSGNLSIVASSPSNDQCPGALSLADATSFAMSTINATSIGDPLPSCQASFGKGVWFAYTSPASGTVQVSTCGSGFDTVLAVYSGACGQLVPVACNDDNGPACLGNNASLQFAATQGVTYSILAGGYAGYSGNLNIVASIIPVLEIARAGGSVSLTWPGNGMLQSATNLKPIIAWTDLTNGGGLWTEPMTNSTKFFRLVK